MRRVLSVLQSTHPSLFQSPYSPKYYRSHIWITAPDSQHLSYFGISDWAKRHFTIINELRYNLFPRTSYGIANRQHIFAFLQLTEQRRQNNTLREAESIQMQRFMYRQGQPFTLLEMLDFDVELQAPVDMAVVSFNTDVVHSGQFLQYEWIGEIRVLQPSQLTLLMSEAEYNSTYKLLQL